MFLGGVPPNLPLCPTQCVFSFSSLESRHPAAAISHYRDRRGERNASPPSKLFSFGVALFLADPKTSHLVQEVD